MDSSKPEGLGVSMARRKKSKAASSMACVEWEAGSDVRKGSDEADVGGCDQRIKRSTTNPVEMSSTVLPDPLALDDQVPHAAGTRGNDGGEKLFQKKFSGDWTGSQSAWNRHELEKRAGITKNFHTPGDKGGTDLTAPDQRNH